MHINHVAVCSILKSMTGYSLECILKDGFGDNPISKDITEANDGSMNNPYHYRRSCAGWIHELVLNKILQGACSPQLGFSLVSVEMECNSGESIVGWLASNRVRDTEFSALYFIKGCFDMFELGSLFISQHDQRNTIRERCIYASTLNQSVSPHSGALLDELSKSPPSLFIDHVILSMNLPLWHNVGHVAWNGLNGLYKYVRSGAINQLSRTNKYSFSLASNSKLDYFDCAAIATGIGCKFNKFSEHTTDRFFQNSSLIFPLDTMHIYGNISNWLDKAWSSNTKASFQNCLESSKFLSYLPTFILGIKGSSKQCPTDLQVAFTRELAKELLAAHDGNCEIIIEGCWSPMSSVKTPMLLKFIREEKAMFFAISRYLHASCNYLPLSLIGLNAKEKHPTYQIASSASFFDGSCASQAVLEEIPFQLVLYNDQPYGFGSSREAGVHRWCTPEFSQSIKNFPQIILTRNGTQLWRRAIMCSVEHLLSFSYVHPRS